VSGLPLPVGPLQKTLEERLLENLHGREKGALVYLRKEECDILLRLLRNKKAQASLRKQARSAHTAQKAHWIATCVFLHQARNPPGNWEAAVHDAMKTYDVDRSHVTKMLRQLGPERKARMRIGLAMFVAATTGRVPRHVLSTKEAVLVDRYLEDYWR
jgi:hypothetical protein